MGTQITRNRAVAALLATGMLALSAPSAQAKELVYSIIGAPKHIANVQIIGGWAKAVGEATKGRVTVRVLPSPAAPAPRLYDAARKGIVDATHTFNGFLQKSAPLLQVSMLPLIYTSAEANAVALWRTWDKYFKAKTTLPGVEIIGFISNPGGISCSLKGKMDSVDAMKSLKMWTLPGYSAKALTALGVTVVPGPAVRMYPLVSKGTVDGYTGIAMGDARAFKVDQYAKSCTMFPGAIFTATFSMMVNEKTWAALPKADQEAIMSVSGEAFSKRSGVMDQWEQDAYAAFKKDGKTLVEAEGDFADQVRKAWMPMHKAWIEAANKAGIDGQAAYDYYVEQAKAAMKK